MSPPGRFVPSQCVITNSLLHCECWMYFDKTVVVNWLVASFHGGKMTPTTKRSLKNKPQAFEERVRKQRALKFSSYSMKCK